MTKTIRHNTKQLFNVHLKTASLIRHTEPKKPQKVKEGKVK